MRLTSAGCGVSLSPGQSFDAAYKSASPGCEVPVAAGTYPTQFIYPVAGRETAAPVKFVPQGQVTIAGELQIFASSVYIAGTASGSMTSWRSRTFKHLRRLNWTIKSNKFLQVAAAVADPARTETFSNVRFITNTGRKPNATMCPKAGVLYTQNSWEDGTCGPDDGGPPPPTTTTTTTQPPPTTTEPIPPPADFLIFRDEFVPNAQAESNYAKWLTQNPGEKARWEAYRAALLAGQNPPPPTMLTAKGKGLVAAGKMAL